MAEFSLEASPLPAAFPTFDRYKEDVFLADLDRASQAAGVPKLDPSGLDVLLAAFRTSNTVGSLASSKSIGEMFDPTPDSPTMDAKSRLSKLKELGLGHHANLFAEDMTEASFGARVEDLKRELSDRLTLQASGGLTAELLAGIIDPVNFIPIGGVALKGAKTYKAAARAGAVIGAGAAVAQELPLQASQVTRSAGDALPNIAMSTILGSGLGIATHKLLGPQLARKVEARGDAAINDIASGGVQLEKDIKTVAEVHNEALPGVAANAEAKTFLDRAVEIEQQAGHLDDEATKAVAERFSSGGAGGALTPEQRAEVNRIAKDFPDMDRADIIDSVLASYGELSMNKLRPGTAIAAPQAPRPAAAMADAAIGARTKFSTNWTHAPKGGTSPLDELVSVIDKHLSGDMTYTDVAIHLNQTFPEREFTRSSVSGAIDRLRKAGVIPAKTPEFVAGKVTVEKVTSWLKSVGIKNVEVKTHEGGTKYLYFTDPDNANALSRNGLTEIRIPDDGHAGRPLRKNEFGGGRIDTGDRPGSIQGYPVRDASLNASGETYSTMAELLDALKWRLSKSHDGQFLVPPGREPLTRTVEAKVAQPQGIPGQRSLDLNAPRSKKPMGLGADVAALTDSDRVDTRLAGLSVTGMMQGIGKAAKLLPWIGDAIAQGLSHPLLELQQSPFQAARRLVNMITENPYILKVEAGGVVRTEKAFSEIYRAIEGGHATAVKDMEDIFKANRAEFEGKTTYDPQGAPLKQSAHDHFGERVYYAALADGVDELGSEAVERAAAAYKKHVFDPVLELFQDANLLNTEAKLRGADGYVPWVPRIQAIIADKENFLSVHSNAIRASLEADYAAALQRKVEHISKSADEVFAIEAEANTKIAELRKTYNGDDNVTGKIEEARRDKDRIFAELKQEENDKLAKAKERHTADLEGGTAKQAANKKHATDREQIKSEMAVKRKEQMQAAADKIKSETAARDAAIKDIKDKLKADRAALLTVPSDIDRNLLKVDTEEKRLMAADDAAASYYKGITSGADIAFDGGGDIPAHIMPAVLKGRRAIIQQKEFAQLGWGETNIFSMADIYHRTAGAAASMATIFKKAKPFVNAAGEKETRMVGDINMSAALKELADEADMHIASSGGGEAELALRKAKAENIRNLELIRDGTLGKRQQFGSAAVQQAGDMAREFNSWRVMGGSVLASLGDPVNIAVVNGFAKTWQHGIKPAIENFMAYMGKVAAADEPAILRMNRLSAAVIEREKNSYMASLMDLHNPGAEAPKSMQVMRQISKVFWNWTGLTAWTQFWKNVETGVQHARIIDASQRGWKELGQSEQAWLANLRIDQDVLDRIGAQWNGQPQKHSAGIPYGHFEAWTDPLAASRFADALSRESKNVIVTPTVGDRLAFQHTPFGQIAGQFRSYGITAVGRLLARNAALSGLEGDKTGSLYTGLFMLGLMGVVVDASKFMAGDMALDGSSKKDPSKKTWEALAEKWAKTPGEQAYNAIDRTGVFMPLTETSNILQKIGLPNIQGAFSMLARDEKDLRNGSSRFQHRTIPEAMFGPSMGLIEDVAGAARLGSAFGKYMIGMNENSPYPNRFASGEFSLKQRDFGSARRIIPFQNAPIVQQIINAGHQKLGTAFDWPTQ